MTDINGKIALVTGASRGIGAATALKLAAAGAKVGIAARRTDKLESLRNEIVSKGGEALVIEMDVVDPASVEAGVKKLVGAYGAIDILVNNGWRATNMLIIEFPDIDAIRTLFASPEYAPLARQRQAAAGSRTIALRGV